MNLTADNFLVIPTGSWNKSFSQPSDVDHHWTNGSLTIYVDTTPSYNYENGNLAISAPVPST